MDRRSVDGVVRLTSRHGSLVVHGILVDRWRRSIRVVNRRQFVRLVGYRTVKRLCCGGIGGQFGGQSLSRQLVWAILVERVAFGVATLEMGIHFTGNVVHSVSAYNVVFGILVAQIRVQLGALHLHDGFVLILFFEQVPDCVLQVLLVCLWSNALV